MSERSSAGSSPERRIGAVIVAGGVGLRMGARDGRRKQYADLFGEPVLAWAARAFTEHPRVAAVVVVLPEEDVDSPNRSLLSLGVRFAAGGPTRSDSVRNGLAAMPDGADLVLIHDGARPFVSAELIDRVIAAADGGAVVPGTRATDTLKEVREDGSVRATLDRSSVWHAQTPQAFPFAKLVAAHEAAARERWETTDDAGLFEKMGERVVVVEGDSENLKITRPLDLEVARLIAARRRAGAGF